MDWLTGILKMIREQSPYYNMVFAIICVPILFLPVFFSLETLKKIPEIIAWREKYLPYIAIVFVIFFVIGGGQFIKKIADHFKRRNELKQKSYLLSKLQNLYDHPGLKDGFKSQDECIQWANMTAPLLQFDTQYYSNFLASSHRINIKGISANLATSLLNTMKSQIQMAIEELKNDLGKNT